MFATENVNTPPPDHDTSCKIQAKSRQTNKFCNIHPNKVKSKQTNKFCNIHPNKVKSKQTNKFCNIQANKQVLQHPRKQSKIQGNKFCNIQANKCMFIVNNRTVEKGVKYN